jgi:hypothetical protein
MKQATKGATMAISKQVHNTGGSGGHGMQEIDTLKRRLLEDKYQEEKTINKCSCVNGCEFTIIGDIISRKEETLLSIHIRQNNLCPFCRKTEQGSIDFSFCAENQNKLGEYKFLKDDKVYQTIYKPSGYRFLPAEENEDQE